MWKVVENYFIMKKIVLKSPCHAEFLESPTYQREDHEWKAITRYRVWNCFKTYYLIGSNSGLFNESSNITHTDQLQERSNENLISNFYARENV